MSGIGVQSAFNSLPDKYVTTVTTPWCTYAFGGSSFFVDDNLFQQIYIMIHRMHTES